MSSGKRPKESTQSHTAHINACWGNKRSYKCSERLCHHLEWHARTPSRVGAHSGPSSTLVERVEAAVVRVVHASGRAYLRLPHMSPAAPSWTCLPFSEPHAPSRSAAGPPACVETRASQKRLSIGFRAGTIRDPDPDCRCGGNCDCHCDGEVPQNGAVACGVVPVQPHQHGAG